MKTRIFSSLLIVVIIIASSCSPGSTTATAGQIVTSGTWKITLFSESGIDGTINYDGYVFTFSDGGTVTVVKSGATKTGTWGVSGSPGKFNIDLGAKVDANKPLGQLTYIWKILSNTETVIRLTDDNASSNEFLTFSKN